MRSSEVAAQAGVNEQTLRYYERRGLLDEPSRSVSGYRVYPADAVAVVRFVKRAQEHGVQLDEIEELLLLADRGPDDCQDARELAQAKVTQLADRIADLQRIQRSLAELIATCERPRTDRLPPDPDLARRRRKPMKLEILQVPDRPNVALLERRIAEAVAGQQIDVTITHRILDDQAVAAEAGMTGSPTLLVDGEDPFTEAGLVPSVSCRLYPTDTGGIDGAPSVAALRAALHLTPAGTAGPADCCTPATGGESPTSALGAPRAAQPATPAEQAIHQTILRAFAIHGGPPASTELAAVAAEFDTSAQQILNQLHASDVIRLDASGRIGWYIRSPRRRPHTAFRSPMAPGFTRCALSMHSACPQCSMPKS